MSRKMLGAPALVELTAFIALANLCTRTTPQADWSHKPIGHRTGGRLAEPDHQRRRAAGVAHRMYARLSD
jgi:hypothetical protein